MKKESKAIPKTELNKRLRAERRAAGLVSVPNLWVKPENVDKLKDFARSLQ